MRIEEKRSQKHVDSGLTLRVEEKRSQKHVDGGLTLRIEEKRSQKHVDGGLTLRIEEKRSQKHVDGGLTLRVEDADRDGHVALVVLVVQHVLVEVGADEGVVAHHLVADGGARALVDPQSVGAGLLPALDHLLPHAAHQAVQELVTYVLEEN